MNHSLLLQDLSLNELACTPQVSPTATYQEIIQGKNMSLVIISIYISYDEYGPDNIPLHCQVCTVTSTPAPTITWWYRGLFINNGSTMVSDIGHVSAQQQPQTL